jgi:hypothetical protein
VPAEHQKPIVLFHSVPIPTSKQGQQNDRLLERIRTQVKQREPGRAIGPGPRCPRSWVRTGVAEPWRGIGGWIEESRWGWTVEI